MPETTNKPGAINTDISGLQITARAEEEGMSERESQRSCFLNFSNINKSNIRDNNNINALYTSNKSVNV